MFKLFSTTLVFVSVCVALQAQVRPTDPIMLPVEGYVITNAGDTLRGKVNVQMATGYVLQIAFKNEKTGEKAKYKPDDIKGFCQKRSILFKDMNDMTTIDKDWVHYETRKHPKKDKKVFMELLLEGKKIRIFENPNGVGSTTSVMGVIVEADSYSYYVAKNGQPPVVLNIGNFKKDFPKMTEDCPAFQTFLKNEDKKNKFKYLGFLIENYNLLCK